MSVKQMKSNAKIKDLPLLCLHCAHSYDFQSTDRYNHSPGVCVLGFCCDVADRMAKDDNQVLILRNIRTICNDFKEARK